MANDDPVAVVLYLTLNFFFPAYDSLVEEEVHDVLHEESVGRVEMTEAHDDEKK